MDKSKEKFIEVWDKLAKNFVLLGLETDRQKTWEKIKEIKREMLNVAEEVADEKFGGRNRNNEKRISTTK